MIAETLFHFVKFLFHFDKPCTQTTKREQQALRHYARDVSIAVEIGVFEGFNTVLIAKEINSQGRLYGIDPFFKGTLGVSWQKMIAQKHLKRAGVSSRVHLIEEPSVAAAKKISTSPDFIFVDGDHSFEGIKNDWHLYSRLLKPGGFIALHDTAVPAHQLWKKNMDSVHYFNDVIRCQPEFEIVETVDSLNILRKK